MSSEKRLVDGHGRRVRKLRVSLTDKCNLRCHYCMPLSATFMNEDKFMSPKEYKTVVSELCDYGLEELRITGGEPLLRASFKDFLGEIKDLPLKKIGLTTNAILLDRYLDDLVWAGVNHLNISLDSLDSENFQKITHGKKLRTVLRNIELAKNRGLEVKINMVAMKGVNDHEILDFVEYAKNMEIEVRFLELMRIGHALEEQNQQFMAAKEIIDLLKENFQLRPVKKELDSTSFNYLLDNGAEIGFIASESMPFCGSCSRWRMSSDGTLRACLLKDAGVSVKNTTSEERKAIYHRLLGMKPNTRPREVKHQMNEIGG